MESHTHAALEAWKAYIQGQLPLEEEQRLEKMLLEDEESVLLYAEALSLLENEMPLMSEEELWLDELMSALPAVPEPSSDHAKEPGKVAQWFAQPWLQYVIAASITLLLMTSGFFDALFSRANEAMHHSNDISVSDQLMDTATSWFDKMKK